MGPPRFNFFIDKKVNFSLIFLMNVVKKQSIINPKSFFETFIRNFCRRSLSNMGKLVPSWDPVSESEGNVWNGLRLLLHFSLIKIVQGRCFDRSVCYKSSRVLHDWIFASSIRKLVPKPFLLSTLCCELW